MYAFIIRAVTLVGAGLWLVTALPANAQSASVVSPLVVAKPAKGAKKITPVSQLAPLPDLSPEQLALADRVFLGKMPCELATYVAVKPDPRGPGRFVLELGKQGSSQKLPQIFSMVPVVSLTGALRLEDQNTGAVWIQLGNKSMLMDQKAGHRLADACVSADQAIVAKALERNPVPGLLDAPEVLQTANPTAAVPVKKVLADAQPDAK